MKTCNSLMIAVLLCLCNAAFLTGCGNGRTEEAVLPQTEGVRLLDLSAIEPAADGRGTVIRAFVQPSPDGEVEGYRFELYAYVPRAANPRGKRILLWPDVVPGKPDTENRLWKPHLKAFEITLPTELNLSTKNTYLLEITEITDNRIRHGDLLKVAPKTAK